MSRGTVSSGVPEFLAAMLICSRSKEPSVVNSTMASPLALSVRLEAACIEEFEGGHIAVMDEMTVHIEQGLAVGPLQDAVLRPDLVEHRQTGAFLARASAARTWRRADIWSASLALSGRRKSVSDDLVNRAPQVVALVRLLDYDGCAVVAV